MVRNRRMASLTTPAHGKGGPREMGLVAGVETLHETPLPRGDGSGHRSPETQAVLACLIQQNLLP